MAAGKPGLEGRKELEADPSTATAAPVNSGGQSTGSPLIQYPIIGREFSVILQLCATGPAFALESTTGPADPSAYRPAQSCHAWLVQSGLCGKPLRGMAIMLRDVDAFVDGAKVQCLYNCPSLYPQQQCACMQAGMEGSMAMARWAQSRLVSPVRPLMRRPTTEWESSRRRAFCRRDPTPWQGLLASQTQRT